MTPTELSDLSQQFRTKVQGAMSLNIAFIGVVNNLFDVLNCAGQSDTMTLARSASLDRSYVQRWAEAAYALEYLDLTDGLFSLINLGRAQVKRFWGKEKTYCPGSGPCLKATSPASSNVKSARGFPFSRRSTKKAAGWSISVAAMAGISGLSP